MRPVQVFTASFVVALVWTASVSAEPAAVAEPYNRGTEALKAGDNDGAIKAYNEAIAADPNIEVVWANRGTAYLNKGDDDQAISDLSRAISLDASDVIAYDNRGKAYLHKKRYEEAIADFTKAINLGTDDPKVWLGRALARQARGDDSGANADLETAKSKDPRIAAALAANAKAAPAWRLLMPMTIKDKEGKFVAVTGAPLWSWLSMGEYSNSQDCETERESYMHNPFFKTDALEQATGAAQCVAADDQRLKR